MFGKHFFAALSVAAGIAASFSATSAQSAPILEQISPNSKVYNFGSGLDFTFFGLSAVADVTAKLQFVPGLSSGGGCNAADFAGFTAGSIALISRGSCLFSEKYGNAQNAGAVGVLIANNSTTGANGIGGVPLFPLTIPVFSTSLELGQEFLALLNTGPVTVRMSSIDALAVPGPVVGAGLPGLALAVGGLFAWRRRRVADS